MLQRNVSRQAINDKGRGRSVEFVMPGLDPGIHVFFSAKQ
jgi:hypothetical protein